MSKRDRNRSTKPEGASGDWVYGIHAVEAALANARRTIRRVVALPQIAGRMRGKTHKVETIDEPTMRRLLGADAVHQGVAALVGPLVESGLEALLDLPPGKRLAVVLDQITDPHNVGAILRSAAAFGADAVIMQERHSPPLTGVAAKAASGAADRLAIIRVVNIARTIGELKDAGFTVAGLAEEAAQTMAELKLSGDVALVLGAEGEGLRRLVRESCDVLAKLPTAPEFPSLNVSNAAAIALYELRRQ